jgi:hypothetical protein
MSPDRYFDNYIAQISSNLVGRIIEDTEMSADKALEFLVFSETYRKITDQEDTYYQWPLGRMYEMLSAEMPDD